MSTVNAVEDSALVIAEVPAPVEVKNEGLPSFSSNDQDLLSDSWPQTPTIAS